jgi:hypothetical protein
MIFLIFNKIIFFFYRAGEVLIKLFKRISRLVLHPKHLQHLLSSETYYQEASIFSRFAFWIIEGCILVLDIFGLPEWYESFADIFKLNTRPLNEKEIAIGQSVYGSSINWERVRIDERSYVGPKQKGMIYVSFYTINGFGSMSTAPFIHELMHIWQFENVGSCYIPRALFAQRTKMGYNYGGLHPLSLNMENQKGLSAFNYEQQADIVMDYYNLKNLLPLKWSNAKQADLEVYTYYKNIVFT